ncbi:MAG: NAD(P)H-binding protein [Pedobacter sp.]
MTISILGCGWYGLPLAKRLLASGYTIKGSTTSESKLSQLEREGIMPYLVNFSSNEDSYDPSFFEADVLIISLPPKKSAGEHGEYPQKMKRIVDALQKGKIKSVLMISSTSVYGDVNREVVVGEIPLPDNESGAAILEAERIIGEYKSIDLTILRFGGLIGPGRNLAKFFSGKTEVANGLAPVNLLHLEECILLTEHILNTHAFGYTLNACSPDHPTRMEIYTTISEITGLAKPDFLPELVKWKLVNGNGVSEQLNYKYLVNKWSEFLTPDNL